jgi:hypothetical protein
MVQTSNAGPQKGQIAVMKLPIISTFIHPLFLEFKSFCPLLPVPLCARRDEQALWFGGNHRTFCSVCQELFVRYPKNFKIKPQGLS